MKYDHKLYGEPVDSRHIKLFNDLQEVRKQLLEANNKNDELERKYNNVYSDRDKCIAAYKLVKLDHDNLKSKFKVIEIIKILNKVLLFCWVVLILISFIFVPTKFIDTIFNAALSTAIINLIFAIAIIFTDSEFKL